MSILDNLIVNINNLYFLNTTILTIFVIFCSFYVAPLTGIIEIASIWILNETRSIRNSSRVL